MRLPVTTDLKTRLSNTTKDARLVNALIEQKADGPNARKRPGMIATGWNFTSPQGIGLGLGGLAAMIYSDTLELIDVADPPYYPPGVYIGDLVDGWYAMIDAPPTAPGPGDVYWSVSAPGTNRYRAWNYKQWLNAGGSLYDEVTVVYPNIQTLSIVISPYWVLSGGWGPSSVAASSAAAGQAWVDSLPTGYGTLTEGRSDLIGSIGYANVRRDASRSIGHVASTGNTGIGEVIDTWSASMWGYNSISGDPAHETSSLGNAVYCNVYRIS